MGTDTSGNFSKLVHKYPEISQLILQTLCFSSYWKLGLWENCCVHLGKGSSGHLDTALIRGIDFEIMAESAMETKQPTTREASIVTWEKRGNWEGTAINTYMEERMLISPFTSPLPLLFISPVYSLTILSQPC